MKKILVVCLLAIGVAACNPQEAQLIRDKLQVVQVPQEYYDRCPVLKTLPNSKTLTDKQVSNLVLQLYKNNVECKRAMDAIKDYLAKADAELAE